MKHVLRVEHNGQVVGQLGYESLEDRFGFEYDPDWAAAKSAFSLSPHILHTGETPVAGAVHRFVENLLPEGRALEVAAAANQLSKDNVYGLIHALGAEPVGAFSFLPSTGTRPLPETERRVITPEELSQRIREREILPFPVWDRKVRLSIAGYQDKLQVLVEGDRIALADGALSSTHILKPEARNPNTPFMVANEHFCMTLSSALGIPTARVEIRRIPEPILLIERFDRVAHLDPEHPGQIRSVDRLHIIDGCQALDLPSRFKYERNFGHGKDVQNIREGASFAKLFGLEPHFEDPARARLFLLRWALLQLLLGNSDAHGKNVSFFLHRTRLTPAPVYDLVSVNAYGGSDVVEQEFAMAYGDAFLLEELTPVELADFSKRIGVRPALVARELKRLAESALTVAPALAKSEAYVGGERDLIQQVTRFICAQAERLLKLAPLISKVNQDLL
jgi:serine/threonine-protein kinase HipA